MPCASSCNEEAVSLRKQLLEHRRERAAAPGPAVFLSERNFDMKPQIFTWKKLTADELTRVYLDEMRRDFPPSELKPLSMILNSEAVGMAHTWGVFEGETLVSYLLMVQPMGCEVSQLDYFSVLPAYRSTGIGARLLAALPAHEEGAKAILIEAECPEKADVWAFMPAAGPLTPAGRSIFSTHGSGCWSCPLRVRRWMQRRPTKSWPTATAG